MHSALLAAFQEAFRNLRANFIQTILSVLGTIIGVAALVAMLSLIDGFEKVAREGIAKNSSAQTVFVTRNTTRRLDGVEVAMDQVAYLSPPLVDSMLAQLPYPADGYQYASGTAMLTPRDSLTRLGVQYMARALPLTRDAPQIAYGRSLAAGDDASRPAAVINHALAQRIVGTDRPVEAALGRQVRLFGTSLAVVGIRVREEQEPVLEVLLPLPVLAASPDSIAYSTSAILTFERIEDVRPGLAFIESWFAGRFPSIEAPVRAWANVDMIKNLELGFTVFRLVMGFLIGIAVVVGGVGVMNVLLMSISERTAEIGVRKAVGANRRRIMMQFLAESVAISAIGSFFGLVLGGVLAVVSATVITYLVDKLEFEAVFRVQTLLIVGGVALLTGVIFGTYPARRAAGMDPVQAIQRA